MFKRVFAKYVTVVMAVLAVGFAILFVVLTSITRNVLIERVAEDMSEISAVAASYLEERLQELGGESEGTTIEHVLIVADSNVEGLFFPLLVSHREMQLMVSDANGLLLARYSESEAFADGATAMPIRREAISGSGTSVMESTRLPGFFDGEVLLHTVGIYSETGALEGYLSVATAMAPNEKAMSDLSKTVVSAVLLVLLAAMIAVYLISERITSPLREMSSVARKMAKGDFKSRVRVQGCDEVAELSVAFNHMAESLENLEKMRSSFIANVSHDLRTPMTTIAGFIDGIRDGVVAPSDRDHYLGRISAEVKRLSRLVSSLLDLSRLQAGDRKFTPMVFDVCEMARVILISFEKQIEEKDLEVALDAERDRMTVWADHDAIYQVMYNICHNAIKFSKTGGLLRIRIAEQAHNKVEVAVYNEGEGIPREDLPHVFEQFYKSDKSRGLDKNGIGLGLFISKTVMEALGEEIRVESESGKNCEFFFTVPMHRAGEESPASGSRAGHHLKGEEKHG